MEEIVSGSLFFGFAATFGCFVAGCAVHKVINKPLFNPLIVANVSIVLLLALTGISYESYAKGARYVGDLLTPATVCLAIPLYRQLHLLKKHARAICCGIAVGVAANTLCILLSALVFNFSRTIYATLLPKSITAAIAMPLAQELGGIPAIALLSVIVTGSFGYVASPAILRLFRVTDTVAKGIAIGTGAHAFGTVKAFELGEAEGAMSSLAIAATGLVTVAIAPFAMMLY